MGKFAVNTTEGLNVIGGYVQGFGRYPMNPELNIFDFDKSQYDLKYMQAYKLGDNELILDEAKKAEIDAQINQEELLAEAQELHQKLQETDYYRNVIAEGDADEEYYAKLKADRHEWRMRIREIENLTGTKIR